MPGAWPTAVAIRWLVGGATFAVAALPWGTLTLTQPLGGGAERHRLPRALAALSDQRLDREQPAQRGRAEQSGDQQEGDQQQLLE